MIINHDTCNVLKLMLSTLHVFMLIFSSHNLLKYYNPHFQDKETEVIETNLPRIIPIVTDRDRTQNLVCLIPNSISLLYHRDAHFNQKSNIEDMRNFSIFNIKREF